MKTLSLSVARIRQFTESAIGVDLHAKRVLSLGNAVTGALAAAALAIHAIGLGLSEAAGLRSKHAIKQVDRLFSSQGINVWEQFTSWVPFVVGLRPSVVVTLDWTALNLTVTIGPRSA